MAKKEVSADVEELRKAEKVIGTDLALKMLRKGKLKKVFLAANCSPETREDVERLCAVHGIACVTLPQSSEEVGSICKKPFDISVVGIMA